LDLEVGAVGVTLSRVIHWEGVHRVIDTLDLHDTQERAIKSGDESFARTPAKASVAASPAPASRGTATPAMGAGANEMVPSSPADTVPNAIYVNGLPSDCTEADIREVFGQFGDIKMVNARHVATGGFSFVFFRNEQGAAAALENPRITIKDKVANVLAKKQILGSGGR